MGSSKFFKTCAGFFQLQYQLPGGTEEGFMEDYVSKFGSLKLRASYGVLGNQSVDNYSSDYLRYQYPECIWLQQQPGGAGRFSYLPILTCAGKRRRHSMPVWMPLF